MLQMFESIVQNSLGSGYKPDYMGPFQKKTVLCPLSPAVPLS